MLPRRLIMLLVLAAGVALIAGAPARSTLSSPRSAQSLPTLAAATPGLQDQLAPYPDGFSLTALALASLADAPANPAIIRLERYTLSPDDELSGATAGARFVAVEAGSIHVSGAGIEPGEYRTGQFLSIPPDAEATLSPAAEGATFLQLRVEPEATATTRLESAAVPQVLVSGEPRLPRGEATISIVRLTVAPGADAGQRVFSGPVGLAIESGALTVVDLDDRPTRLEAGGSLIAPAYTAHHLRNEGSEPVTGLAVAVLPVSSALAGAPVATPTPATDLAATATFAALTQSEQDLRATVAAQATAGAEQDARLATSEAAGAAAITSAQATTAAVGIGVLELSSNVATANARAFEAESALAAMEPTVAAQAAELNAAAAREASLVATSQAQAAAAANQAAAADAEANRANAAEATARAAGDGVAQAEATNSAQARALQTVIATATAQALRADAVQGTLTAQLGDAQSNMTSLAAAEGTRAAELAIAQQTVTAQGDAIATIAAATAPAIDPNYREVMIEDNVSGVVGGDPASRQAVLAAVQQVLRAEIDQGCTAGLVLTFGYTPQGEIDAGVQLAGAINVLLQEELPGMFEPAVTEEFVNFEAPYGRSQIRVYLTTGCGQASPEIAPAAPTSPPIIPSTQG